MQKYGFVYIWRDRKHKRYYIGCHWGAEIDKYICSSRHMNLAYKRRPQDFKRRILSRIYTNRTDLFNEEYKWLCFIKPEELRVRYYNIKIATPYHWAAQLDTRSIRQKISDSVKKSLLDPGVQERKRLAYENRNLGTPEERHERAIRAGQKLKGRRRAPETIEKIRNHHQGKTFHTQTEPEKQKRKETMSQYRVTCLCCKKEFSIGTFSNHINRGNKKSRDPTLHTFSHPEYGNVTCTRYEFSQKFGGHTNMANILGLVKGKFQTFKGWKLA